MEHLDERLKAVSNVQNMNRVAYSTLLLLSLLILISQFNAYFSWYVPFVKQPSEGQRIAKHIAENRQLLRAQWVEGRAFKLPFFDIPILPSDIAILGGLSILVATTFFLFCSRREYFAISHLLADTQKEDRSVKLSVLHTILSRCVFMTFVRQEKPFKDTQKEDNSVKLSVWQTKCLRCCVFTRPYTMLKDVPIRPFIGRKPHLFALLLIMFPAIAILIAIFTDNWSYWTDSVFRDHPPSDDWNENGGEYIWRNFVAALVLFFTTWWCAKIWKTQENTGNLLMEYNSGCPSS